MNYALEYYHKNKEILNQKRRERYKTNPDVHYKAKIRSEIFWSLNPDKKYPYSPNAKRLNYREWKERYPDQYAKRIETNRIRRQIKYKNDVSYRKKEIKRCAENSIVRIQNSRSDGIKLTKDIIKSIYVRDKYTCILCKKNGQQTRLSLDHIFPISKGGKNNIENLQILCLDCNRKKSNKI